MDQETKAYIDQKFQEASAKESDTRAEAKELLYRRQAAIRRMILACTIVLLSLLGLMLSILWKYQIAPRF